MECVVRAPYRVDPVYVGADLCEDRGLLGEVAAETRTKADNAMNLPRSISILTIQRTARVPLKRQKQTTPKTKIICSAFLRVCTKVFRLISLLWNLAVVIVHAHIAA